jgi:hypothetical protein
VRPEYQSENYELTNTKAVLYSILIFLISIAGFVLGGFVPSAWQTIVYSISSTLLAIGLISFIYEIAMRRAIGRELLRLVGIERSIASTGLRRTVEASNIDWQAIIGNSHVFEIILIDPTNWVQSHWAKVMAAGKDHRIVVDIFLPNTEGETFPRIATYLGVSPEEFKISVNRAKTVIEESWKMADSTQALQIGSKISIRQFDGFPTYSIIKVDQLTVIILCSCTKRSLAENGFSLIFEGEKNDYPTNWFSLEIDSLKNNASVYENETRRRQ